MATAQERMQEIANRGLQDKLSVDKKARFDEAVRRGLVTPPEEKGVFDSVKGPAEAALTVGSAVIAEPAAGVAGIVQSLNPFAEEGAGAEAVESTREAMTVEPKTPEGKQALGTFSEAVEPIAKMFRDTEDYLGAETFEKTGSPVLAAAATTIPTAIAEVLGFAAGKGAIRAGKTVDDIQTNKAMSEAAPTIDQLKDTSRAVFNEIDDLGVRIKRNGYEALLRKLNKETRDSGIDPDVTPKSSKALARFNELSKQNVSLRELDAARAVAQNAAKSLEPAERALGLRMINIVDDFLDNADQKFFTGKNTSQIGERYKVARNLWGRARRSEMIQDAFEKARNQASGFENGVRVQFRSILNNKKKSRYFSKDELDVMKRVVRGDKTENLFKLIGRLGFSEGGATNIVGGALGATAGGVAFGTPGAVAVPIIGQVSRKLAQRMTAKNAEFADQVVRAGNDARRITKAYLDNTPKNQRSASELSELLMRPGINLNKIPDNVISLEAARIAKDRRAAVEAAAAAGAASSASQNISGGQ